MIIKIPVVTRTQDNGDGGYTTSAYNSKEELLADHPASRNGPLTDKQKADILDEDDPYENGYIGSDEIEIEITKQADGLKARLASPISFHAGQ